MRWLFALACGALALGVACEGEDWIVAGELPAGMRSGDDRGDNPELVSDPSACPASLELLDQRRQQYGPAAVAASHVGRWRGTLGAALDDAAAAGFPSRELVLDIDAGGAGTLLFDAAPSDEPGGADDGYLCRADASGVVCGSRSGFVAGFAYPIWGAQSRDGVLTFVIAMADPWGSWCAEHEPVSWEAPAGACGAAFGVLPPGDPRWSAQGCSRVTADGAEAIDCALMYALEYCQCARDACFADLERDLEVGLMLSPDSTALSGSLWYENEMDAASVVLTRAP